ncbi:MAG: hypothetical protein ACR2MD_13660, partial [Aridibacter sp.]
RNTMQKQDFQTLNKTQNVRFVLITVISLLLMITFLGTNAALAQTRGAKRKISKQTNYKRGQKKDSKTVVPLQDNIAEVNANQPLPITVVNTAETNYLSGEASVVVNPKQPTVVRLGLSQNAVSIVEFPASDGVYYIHEGNPKLVSVFQSPTRETDRSITIYPGEGFVAGRESGGGERNPSATIILQMRSGLILILEFVPVSDLRKNAHRCVINYNRDEVIAARRSAGLAYNLGEDVKPTDGRNTRASSKLVGSTTNETIEEITDETDAQTVRLASLELNRGAVSRKNDKKSKQIPKTGLELSRLVNKKLADCLKNPAKNLGGFSDVSNGLSLAVSPVTEIDAEQRLVIIAVRNNAVANLRLVPGTPELQIQTADDKGNALQTERLERTYVETTSFEGLIQPGSTVYYALVYNAPVMGASQRLRVLVSHREAADTPTTVVLPTVNAIEE